MNLQEFKTAAQIADEVSPDVKYFIYCYKDKALNKYTPPYIEDKEPSLMVDGLKNSIIKASPEQVKKVVNMQFCFVGTVEINSGKIETFNSPEMIIDCDVLIEKVGITNDGKVC